VSTDSPAVVDKLLEVQSQMQGLMQQNQQMMMAIAMMCQQQGIQMQSLVTQVASVDSRLNQIEAAQQEAITSLDEIPEPEIEAEVLTTRAKLNRLVRDYSAANAIHFQEVWKRVYREFRDRYHMDLKARAKNLPAKFGALDVCEQQGLIEELYAVAFELLKA
jgi:seryl-tRNA synthetase